MRSPAEWPIRWRLTLVFSAAMDPAPMPIAAAATAETPNCTMRFIAFS